MKNFLTLILISLLLAGCNSKSTRIKIFANGELEKASAGNEITIRPNRNYLEKELELNASQPLKATVGNQTYEATPDGEGYYAWNLKTDTLVGSRQWLNQGATEQQTMTQQRLKQVIDSLELLVIGRNINAANQNFMLEPGRLVKLTSSQDVLVVGPFNSLPKQLDESKYSINTEVFRFYTVKDVREQITRLKGFVAPDSSTVQ